EFIIHMRLKRAAQLLKNSDMNISEIAYMLGFCDHAHFTRHFRRAFNCTPKEYRKRAAASSA
ncbi:MAG: helix-turn-helix transcriptional regulator, partial [candidate division KSB1 bacterium]|nr:helix-turn-helix transcriptional regulator [candidate division KSB1 bacterium]